MIAQTARRISEIDLARVKLGEKLVRGQLPLYYGGERLVFQTPYLQVTQARAQRGQSMGQVTTIFSGSEEAKLDGFLQFVEGLEQRITQHLISRATDLGLSGQLRLKKLIKAPPTDDELYIPWPINGDCSYVRADYTRFPAEHLTEGHYVRLIVSIPSFWVRDGCCGLTAVVRKVMVYPPPGEEADYDFQSDDDDECPLGETHDQLVTAYSSAATVALAPRARMDDTDALLQLMDDDSDDEEDLLLEDL